MIEYSNGVIPPGNNNEDISYTCSAIKERNVVTNTFFLKQADTTHMFTTQDDKDYSTCDGFPRDNIIL